MTYGSRKCSHRKIIYVRTGSKERPVKQNHKTRIMKSTSILLSVIAICVTMESCKGRKCNDPDHADIVTEVKSGDILENRVLTAEEQRSLTPALSLQHT